MPSVRRNTLGQAVIQHIKQYIIDHGLKPGDRLPTEMELGEMFGVSRVTIREATKALCFMGIIDAAPRRGLILAHLDLRRMMQSIEFYLSLHREDHAQFLQSRLMLEAGALKEAMTNVHQWRHQLDPLRKLNQQMAKATDGETFTELNRNFHAQLVGLSDLKPLNSMCECLLSYFVATGGKPTHAPEKWTAAASEHDQILDALLSENLPLAQGVLCHHIQQHNGYM